MPSMSLSARRVLTVGPSASALACCVDVVDVACGALVACCADDAVVVVDVFTVVAVVTGFTTLTTGSGASALRDAVATRACCDV
jgi:hypothetical protein